MKSFARQLQRSICSGGFWSSVCIMLFALQFVHMDAGLFWRDPLAYFGSGDFYYTFIISVYRGLLRFLLPLCGILPLSMAYVEDSDTRFLLASLHRQTPTRYTITRMFSAMWAAALAVVVSISFTVALYLIVCPVEFQEDAYQVFTMNTVYGWRAQPEYFHVFILEAMGRLALSASMWALVGLGFSALFSNRVFVIVATMATSYTLDSFLSSIDAVHWTVAFIQAPDILTVTSLSEPFLKQIGYLAICLSLCFVSLRIALSSRIKKRLIMLLSKATRILEHILPPQHLWMPNGLSATFLGRLWVDIRLFLTPLSILSTIVLTSLCVLIGPVMSYSRFTIGEMLVSIFGGVEWANPLVDVYGIGRWILLLLAPMTGIAYSLSREISGRQVISVYRYSSVQAWWASKSLACICNTIFAVIIMFVWAGILSFIFGGRGLTVYLADADGFMIPRPDALPLLFTQFLLQVIMMTQLQVLFHLLFMDMRAGVIAYLLPLVSLLMSCSYVEKIPNIWAPVNWGMMLRSEFYCVSGYFTHENDWIALCSVSIPNAILMQLLVICLLFMSHRLVVRYLPITTKNALN